MKGSKVLGLVLLVLGVLASAYGGFSYTKEDTKARLGPLEVNVREHKKKETRTIPADEFVSNLRRDVAARTSTI